MDRKNDIFDFLPKKISRLLRARAPDIQSRLEEICLKPNRPLFVVTDRDIFFVSPGGELQREPGGSYFVSCEDMEEALERVTNGSYYSMQEDIKAGFITLQGGHRVGICGKAASFEDKILSITEIAALNYRIAREVRGSADSILPHVIDNGKICSTLIISPPRCGKTTILRDLARQLSDGVSDLEFSGVKVAISDERNEIAACVNGIPQHDVGAKTDVMYHMKKSEAMLMLIRSMSPQVLITDEIGTEQDAYAIHMALSSGVPVIASVHGEDLKDISLRANINELVESRVFRRVIVLGFENGTRTVKNILRNEG